MMGQPLDRIGLIVNPAAGGDTDRAVAVGRQALEHLGARHVSTGRGTLGEESARGVRHDIVETASRSGSLATRELARRFAELGLGTVIVIGGDGTMADVAIEFAEFDSAPSLIGIGAGSANAGTLITCKPDSLERLAAGSLSRVPVDALEVSAGDERALAFNDVAIGTTMVGTVDGRLVDLDALAMLAGERKRGAPASIEAADAEVSVLRGGTVGPVARGKAVGTVVVGFCDSSFFARAVTGGACLASLCGLPAAVIAADQPLVRVELDADRLLAAPPIRSAFAALDGASTVSVRGMPRHAVVIADGNPLCALGPGIDASIVIRRGAVTAMKITQAPA